MPSYIERRKKIDSIDNQLNKLLDTPENTNIRDNLNIQLDALLEPPKWWCALLIPQKEQEKNTKFVKLSNFKAEYYPHIQIIIKLTSRKHSEKLSCCSVIKSIRITKDILTAALPITQPNGELWDFEKYDEFVPRWRDCGGDCGCCGLFDIIKLLDWKIIFHPVR